MSTATARLNGAACSSRPRQSRDEPGFPWTNTTASDAWASPAINAGDCRPPTVNTTCSIIERLLSFWGGAGAIGKRDGLAQIDPNSLEKRGWGQEFDGSVDTCTKAIEVLGHVHVLGRRGE